MRATMGEAIVGDNLTLCRVTSVLDRLAYVIDDLTALRNGCNPTVFYSIRPWFRDADSDPAWRPWVFAGLAQDDYPVRAHPAELSGASAGQSALVHALDVFLGVAAFSHVPASRATPQPGRKRPRSSCACSCTFRGTTATSSRTSRWTRAEDIQSSYRRYIPVPVTFRLNPVHLR
ncbi:hypothetical protein B0H10DRAFT_2197461 [Mycena sp. CBHHK59/15]|nr:hypothetical protein B0H10DRAFT_2197461 [Mycena sp. CBHHK59/15]